jgi:hypothetical protein
MIENIDTSWVIIGILLLIIVVALKSIRKVAGRLLIAFGIIAWFARIIDTYIAIILIIVGLIISSI